ncbi:MAG: Tfp pilus assembly protein FimT/FimU [Patescibacteria group bacterium]
MKKSFTLVEMFLVIAIFGILASFSIPFLIDFKIGQDLDSVTEEMISVLKKAQIKSINSEKDSSWGVNFSQPYQYILFREMFNPGHPENEIYEYPQNITLTTSAIEVKFSKLKGTINEEFRIELTSFNKKRIILINQEGTINYYRQ